jgi:4-oxalmesaconate hydratase
VADLKISDDELRETIEANQLKLMKQRGSDLTIFSPRASFMAHHIGDFQVSSAPGPRSATSSASAWPAVPGALHPRGHAAAEPGVDPRPASPSW